MGLPSMESTDEVHHRHPLSTVQMSKSQTATLLLLPALEVMSYAQEEVLHLTMKVAYLRQKRLNLQLFQGLKLNKTLQNLLQKTKQRDVIFFLDLEMSGRRSPNRGSMP